MFSQRRVMLDRQILRSEYGINHTRPVRCGHDRHAASGHDVSSCDFCYFESMSSTSTWAPRHTLLWILVAINVGGILLAGLSLKGFDFRNNVEWTSDGTGIEFGEHGLAYTDTFTTGEDTDQRTRQDFTIEIALRPHESSESGFRFIAVVHSGDDDEQLVIAQWRETIIVMNGDDYDHSRRLPRLTASVPDYDDGLFLLAVSSDARGSALYIDGQEVDSRESMSLRLPTDFAPGRLVLGNSAYGDNPWQGTIAGFALHLAALDERTLRNHRDLWAHGQGFAGDDYVSARLSYPLSERTGRRALDRSLNETVLQFPRDKTFVDPKVFVPGLGSLDDSRDVGFNLGGFFPLGFLLAALLSRVTRMTQLPTLASVIAIGFALSFSIELGQGWIPSRSSTLLDLLLNVVGTSLGGAAFVMVSRKWRWDSPATRSRPEPGGVPPPA